MDNIPATAYIAIGAVIAALITGFWSFINLIISKDQKVSEFRQAWIDGLRAESSDYVGLVSSLAASWAVNSKRDDVHNIGSEFVSENIDRIREIDANGTRIKLRLNPNEHNNEILLLKDIEEMISNPDELALRTLTDTLDKFTCSIQNILKSEWERVKRGEESFNNAKRLSYYIVALSFTIVFAVLYRH